MNAERLKELKAQAGVLERAIEAAESIVRDKRGRLHDVRMEIAFEEHGVKVGCIVTGRGGKTYKVSMVDSGFSDSKPWLKGFKKTKDGWSKRACHVFGWTNPRPE